LEIAMNKPVFPKPKCAAAPIEPEAPRARKKWADLHSALAQLLEAHTIAGDGSKPGEPT
jgi:hypothetical protein